MFYYYNALQTKSGDILPDYLVRLLDASGNEVEIFADNSGTPIISVSGVANAAKADDLGMVRFWVPNGTYDIAIYDTTDTFKGREEGVPMFDAGSLTLDLSGTEGATLVGTPTGTVQDDIDARPTTAALASSSGGAMVGIKQAGADAVLRTAAGKLLERVSILDFVPEDEHAAIRDGTSGYDCSPAAQAAVNLAKTVYFPNGKYCFGSTVREKTNGGARCIIGQNRFATMLVALPALAALGEPIFWFGNSNGHGNYRLSFSEFYIDGGDTAGRGAAGAIGLRAHECGTSFIGDLYVKGCSTAIDAIGCIGYSFGGERTEIYASQRGLWHTDPAGGAAPGSTGGDSLTTTESPTTLNDNINHIQNLWFSAVNKPIRIKGGLTQVDHIILQSCGNGAGDDLIHLLEANESYEYGAGPLLSNIWMEGGNYRSAIRIENTRAATIRGGFMSGSGANCEQGIVVIGTGGNTSHGTRIEGVSFRGSWSRTPTEGRTGNHTYYVHSNCRNGFYGPNYYTQASCTPKVEFGVAGHNNIIIDNHTAGNVDKGVSIGNIRISTTAGASTIAVNPDVVAELGPVNWYLIDPVASNSFRSTGYVRADTEYRIGTVKVVGARKTGWATATGTATRTTFDTATVTLPELAARVKALIDDLHATGGHGLIGA